jgi:DNA-binding response OmpR family regulator
MPDINILIADNDPDALVIYGEYLEAAGYRVLKASSVEAARSVLGTHRVHLAILDLRLTDDSESDRSGLQLARETARSTPKLILTKWPTVAAVRDALMLDDEPMPPAVDFLDKLEGLERLGEAVRRALDKYVLINHDLVIEAGQGYPAFFLNLVGLLSPGLHVEHPQSGAEELEDLFRRLFYKKAQVKVERTLWRREGRAAFTVVAFAEGNAPESLVVVCGHKAEMEEDERRYREFAPHAPGHNSTVLSLVGDTEHFAAHAYALAGADLEGVITLEELYHAAPDRTLVGALGNLFEQTLSEWHQESRVPVEDATLARLYGEMLGLPDVDELRHSLEERAAAIVKQLPALGPEARREGGRLTISFGAQTFSYPDPAAHLARLYVESRPVLLMRTPGLLLGSNVLADQKGRTWLTDFAGAGLAPALWNYLSMEAVARFDWAEAGRLQWLHGMETQLAGSEFSKLYAAEVEAPLRKTVRVVQGIRRLALRSNVRQRNDYHLGLLLHAVRRLHDYRPPLQLTGGELTRLAHLLLSSAMIMGRLVPDDKNADGGGPGDAAGIHIDHANRAVWIDGVKVQVRGQSYDLLRELHLHANELCTRASIVERVFGQKYEETNESQISRLNTAIRRLREKIEEDPDRPRYLLTEPHGGYRLIARPLAA